MTPSTARGIHAHDTYKLGRRPPKRAPALRLDRLLTGIPAHPVAISHFGSLKYGLYENDRFGDCGPAAVANLVKLVSKGLTGHVHTPTQAQVFDLYRRSGNPDFDPHTGEGDNGVDMQTMLEALVAGGIGDVVPVAFGSIDPSDDEAIDAAVAIFGGVLYGVDLQVAQQSQTDATPPVWDYSGPHREWGGHAVMNGRYASTLDGVISWGMKVDTTARFRGNQLQEVWAVIFEWHLQHPAFLQGVDLQQLSDDFQALTGRPLPGVTPTSSAQAQAQATAPPEGDTQAQPESEPGTEAQTDSSGNGVEESTEPSA